MLQPPNIVTSTSHRHSDSTDKKLIAKKVDKKPVDKLKMDSRKNSPNDVTHSSSSCENMVEAFLDENSDFLEDYVRRKVIKKNSKFILPL